MGKTPTKLPRWYVEQTERQERFRATLGRRLETDRCMATHSARPIGESSS